MRCLIIDDEPLALRLLEDNVKKVPFLELVGLCSDAFEAIKFLSENQVDLIFTDIQMPGLNGLQLVGSLENRPMVIFVTAYKQYALEGFDLAVVDYLLKPVSLERFLKACHRAKEIFELKKVSRNEPNSLEYFFVNADYSQIKVVFSDIMWIEGLGDYIKIYLKNTPKPLIVRTSIKNIELDLPINKFVRIHKSFLVAFDAITAIRKNSIFINNNEFPIGDSYKSLLVKFLNINH